MNKKFLYPLMVTIAPMSQVADWKRGELVPILPSAPTTPSCLTPCGAAGCRRPVCMGKRRKPTFIVIPAQAGTQLRPFHRHGLRQPAVSFNAAQIEGRPLTASLLLWVPAFCARESGYRGDDGRGRAPCFSPIQTRHATASGAKVRGIPMIERSPGLARGAAV